MLNSLDFLQMMKMKDVVDNLIIALIFLEEDFSIVLKSSFLTLYKLSNKGTTFNTYYYIIKNEN